MPIRRGNNCESLSITPVHFVQKVALMMINMLPTRSRVHKLICSKFKRKTNRPRFCGKFISTRLILNPCVGFRIRRRKRQRNSEFGFVRLITFARRPFNIFAKKSGSRRIHQISGKLRTVYQVRPGARAVRIARKGRSKLDFCAHVGGVNVDDEIQRLERGRRLEKSISRQFFRFNKIPQNSGQRTDERGGSPQSRTQRHHRYRISIPGRFFFFLSNLPIFYFYFSKR